MESSDKFCLKWNDFQTNISASFQDLRRDTDFSDVTLTCDGDTRIEAHRVILAGSSKFFSKVLKQQQHPHPLLYMRGMTASQLSAVVDFVYHGEANIFQEDLDGFLAVAEELQLKGLNGAESKGQDTEEPECVSSKIRRKNNTTSIPEPIHNSDIKANVWQIQKPDNNEFETSVVCSDDYTVKTHTNYEELDATVATMMEKNMDGKWVCKVCGKIENKDRFNMKNHIEGKHIEGVSHPCNLCGKTFRSRNSLAKHLPRCHSSP
jgi:hypothetical protein